MSSAPFFAKPSAANPWHTRLAAAIILGSACTNGFGANVNVVGLFPGKALVSIDGGAPRTLSTGQKATSSITLLAVSADTATFEINGQRRLLRIGQPYQSVAGAGGDTIVLAPDTRGHYITVGAINGRAATFMVDTGATVVALGTRLAERLGVPYRTGRSAVFRTANGEQRAHLVTLASVRIGGITLDQVEAAVTDGMNHSDEVLLGMSFLGRLSMQRDAQSLRLSRAAASTGGSDTRARISLPQTGSGMYATSAKINGITMPFLVDTGASSVSIDATMARQAGIDYQKGTPVWLNTANGIAKGWRVRLDSVVVGPITLYGIDATVSEGPGTGGTGLLGMSFLNRVEMKHEGDSLTLIKRF